MLIVYIVPDDYWTILPRNKVLFASWIKLCQLGLVAGYF